MQHSSFLRQASVFARQAIGGDHGPHGNYITGLKNREVKSCGLKRQKLHSWDLEAGTLTIDFALHAAGPATEWALAAQAGDRLEMGGPRGSTIVPDDFDWYLLIGDATALPSVGRRLETMRAGVPVDVFLLVADSAEQQDFSTTANCNFRWLTCAESSRDNVASLRAALEMFHLRAGDGFIWIAAEDILM